MLAQHFGLFDFLDIYHNFDGPRLFWTQKMLFLQRPRIFLVIDPANWSSIFLFLYAKNPKTLFSEFFSKKFFFRVTFLNVRIPWLTNAQYSVDCLHEKKSGWLNKFANIKSTQWNQFDWNFRSNAELNHREFPDEVEADYMVILIATEFQNGYELNWGNLPSFNVILFLFLPLHNVVVDFLGNSADTRVVFGLISREIFGLIKWIVTGEMEIRKIFRTGSNS